MLMKISPIQHHTRSVYLALACKEGQARQLISIFFFFFFTSKVTRMMDLFVVLLITSRKRSN